MGNNNVKDRFLNDVCDHEMMVLHDDGINRHIRFKNPKNSFSWYELVTWKGHLCITGDMGTYVFCRVEDMFTFFRQKELRINPQYWAEKCLSESIFGDGIRQFSQEIFEDAVKSEFRYFIQARRDELDCGDRDAIEQFGSDMREIWWEIQRKLMNHENEFDAMNSVYEFSEGGFQMDDFWETTVTEYTHHFLWALYAIVWGIAQYDSTNLKAA